MDNLELKTIIRIIVYFGHFILALNVFLYFKSYRKNTVAFKTITLYLFYVLIIQLRMSYLGSHKILNLHYTHFYFIGQFVFLSFFFLKEFKTGMLSNVIKIYLILVLTSLAIYYYKFPKTFFKHNIFEVIVTSIPLVIYSFIFFTKRIDSSNKKFIYLNSGLFLYILCSTLIFVAGNLSSGIKNFIWLLNASLYVVYQLLIFLDWYKNFRKTIPLHS